MKFPGIKRLVRFFVALTILVRLPAQWVCSLGSYELQSEAQALSHEIKVTDYVALAVYLIFLQTWA